VLPFVMHYKMRNEQVSEAWTIPEDFYQYDAYWEAADDDVTADGESAPSAQHAPNSPGQSASANLQLLRTLYGYFWNGEFDRIQPLYSPEFVFFAPGRGDLSGGYCGWDGYLTFRRKLTEIAGPLTRFSKRS
jgi:hypothetical protein